MGSELRGQKRRWLDAVIGDLKEMNVVALNRGSRHLQENGFGSSGSSRTVMLRNKEKYFLH